MPWEVKDRMSLIKEFVELATKEGAKIAPLCRQFGISRKTAYKWLARIEAEGLAGLECRTSRPLHSPRRTDEALTEAVLALRLTHPTWGSRKIRAKLEERGHLELPATSTITDILRREGLVISRTRTQNVAVGRFEHDTPNALWQMDFKGHFPTDAGRCHPLTVLDDHSRFSLCLAALPDERRDTVQPMLEEVFRLYGLPERMTMDNGSPWGCSSPGQKHTRLTVWLIRLGIRVGHSRPNHPQTQGKDERFHRTLNEDVVTRNHFRDLLDCQRSFDRWRDLYNTERPHEALGLKAPASRYKPSPRAFPEQLAPIEYLAGDEVRKVQLKGEVHYRGREWRVGKAFVGLPVALRPSEEDGIVEVYFCDHRVAKIDLRQNTRS